MLKEVGLNRKDVGGLLKKSCSLLLLLLSLLE